MAYVIKTSDEFDLWFEGQEKDLKRRIASSMQLLEAFGHRLGRPYVDTLEGSQVTNLKELRVQHRGDPYRILFAFDPKRQAFILIGGNKAGDKHWYKTMIPKAELIFKRHLKTLEQEGNDG